VTAAGGDQPAPPPAPRDAGPPPPLPFARDKSEDFADKLTSKLDAADLVRKVDERLKGLGDNAEAA
jgi:hypothetical protein